MSAVSHAWEVRLAEFVTSAVGRGGFPRGATPEVAFAGRSNVGKSSLINLLVRKRDLARTSNTPGRTQQINFFRINDRWHYVDLPGYGFAKAPRAELEKWREMIEEYFEANERLRLVIVLLDARREPSPLDDQLIGFLNEKQIPTQIVLTKCDKLTSSALAKTRRDISRHYGLPADMQVIATAAAKGQGRDETLKMIYEFLSASPAPQEG
jgi:GTP-binding protein